MLWVLAIININKFPFLEAERILFLFCSGLNWTSVSVSMLALWWGGNFSRVYPRSHVKASRSYWTMSKPLNLCQRRHLLKVVPISLPEKLGDLEFMLMKVCAHWQRIWHDSLLSFLFISSSLLCLLCIYLLFKACHTSLIHSNDSIFSVSLREQVKKAKSTQ